MPTHPNPTNDSSPGQHASGGTADESRAAGRTLRDAVPFDAHADWHPAAGRPDPVDRVLASNAGRQERLIPLRMARMAESPFAFLRGSATVMAWDLAQSPSIGHNVMIDGDAHVSNFGLFRTPRQDVVFDLNDFDETIVAPWEWDLKRLTASFNVAARENGVDAEGRARAVRSACAAYRTTMAELAQVSPYDLWQMRSYASATHIDAPTHLNAAERATIEKTVERAMKRSHTTMLAKVAEPTGKSWRFKDDPPILTKLDAAERNHVVDGLKAYLQTIAGEWRMMLERYDVADVAHRVVGVGSVGMRAYLVLMIGRALGDPLFIQVKEGIVPAAAPFVPPLDEPFRHQGRRVVHGQRLLQSSSDALLGWTTISGRDFYVRQMKDMRGSIPVDWLHGATFDFYAWCLGLLLARAHARTGDAALIAGYCGSSDKLDAAYAGWAERYGTQTVADHAAFVAAIAKGHIKVAPPEK
ncbi:hypothetical protein AWB81_03147 [Caballeronia arationis]|uniref:Uncharacterized conserved protein, DUF2252 family n=1 Tax=Caballeronia arationis TaxID=1777142 RepID=A0A7Z7I9E0_9BURK|nr:DUF2252 domain-containing protein [Caballeronia arationis]SAK70998.1 hypothetical protein AWB81_03147 [Caballeronia arationis]SOE81558.1 Uncharacterized conserved protein, DUF2252 family [Caballeronia arationis]